MLAGEWSWAAAHSNKELLLSALAVEEARFARLELLRCGSRMPKSLERTDYQRPEAGVSDE
jgi:hypothetical protein